MRLPGKDMIEALDAFRILCPSAGSHSDFTLEGSAGGYRCEICEALIVAAPVQLTQSKTLYHAPAKGRNHGLPLYRPSGAPGKGRSTNGFSGLSPAMSSAIFWP